MAILKHTYKVAITRTNIGYDILTNIVTGVTITAWGTAVILLLIKLAIWVFQ